MTDEQMVAMEIVATLPHGVSFGRPWGTSLDGILASVLWHRAKAAATARGDELHYDPLTDNPPDMDLPLARCTLDTPWHWMATFAHTHPATPTPDPRVRTSRTDHTDMTRLATHVPATVSDARGHYRKRIIPAVATVTPTATWRAVGHPDRIAALLDEVTEIGKYRTSGEGRVTAWTITPTPEVEAWSAGHEHHPGVLGRITAPGCLTRHPDIAHGGRASLGVRAPYTHPSRHAADAYLPAE